MEHLLVIHYVLLVVMGWLILGVLGLISLRRTPLVAHMLFPAGAVFGILLFGLGLTGVFASQELVLPLGLPDLPLHLRLDGLSSYFLAVLGVVSTGVSAFSAGYFRKGEGTPPGLICFEYHVCLASMAVLLLADDAYSFMVAWETMTAVGCVPCNDQSPHRGDPPGRLALLPDLPCRRARAPAVLRPAARQYG